MEDLKERKREPNKKFFNGYLQSSVMGLMSKPMSKLDSKTLQLFRHPDKRRAWVKYQVHLQGRSLAQVAKDAGVKRATLYAVFIKTYPRMEKVIADAVGLPPAVLFPERYNADGLPIYRMGRPRKSTANSVKDSTTLRASNVSNHTNNRQVSA